ncbi:MAG: serine/threonine protein kinase, partial [Planctomycetota bacterium]
MSAAPALLLKSDLFGSVYRVSASDGRYVVVRDLGAARRGLRWLARALARREARALRRLAGIEGLPALLHADGERIERSWIDGRPMQLARPRDPAYFRAAARLLRRLHAQDVAHNDLAKEPNWLVTPAGSPALVDFQLAICSRRRGRLFRALARDDIRHLLKHKRTYLPERLTARERRILATPSLP